MSRLAKALKISAVVVGCGAVALGLLVFFFVHSFYNDVLHTDEPPAHALMRALHLKSLPASISTLQMGYYLVPNEQFDFHFHIASEDFPRLLEGQQFRPDPLYFGVEFSALASHTHPPKEIKGYWKYGWDNNDPDAYSMCEVSVNRDKTEVVVNFVAE
jgi:hypothetical protein